MINNIPKFLKSHTITLLFLLGTYNPITARDAGSLTTPVSAHSMPASPSAKPSHQEQVSVHEMFKDIPQDELLQMMEEGQQFIKYLEEHGTEEEKMSFAQAMEETLQGFTEDDWKEFEQIVEVVQDKLPPLVIEPKTPEVIQPVVTEEPKAPTIKASPADETSLEKILHAIYKSIKSILLKAKSDKILSERITMQWENKDYFNEMTRLLQTLNRKDHIAKLTTAGSEEIKALLESIQNFHTRLQMEDNQFIIADTFGLQADEQTSAENLKKLNKILEFFTSAIESLLPKLTKFIQEYEPEALSLAKKHDEDTKKALDNATKVEKLKRPAGQTNYSDRDPAYRQRDNYNPARQGRNYDTGNYTSPQDRRAHNTLDNNDSQKQKMAGPQEKQAGKPADKDEQKKDIKTGYKAAIDSLEDYLIQYDNKDVGQYLNTISNARSVYSAFGKHVGEVPQSIRKYIGENAEAGPMTPDEATTLQRYNDQLTQAHQNFGKNIKDAHSCYAELRESIELITPQIDEMQKVLTTVRTNLAQMSSNELEQLKKSKALKIIEDRLHQFDTELKNAKHLLVNHHRLHKLEQANPAELHEYELLNEKIDKLHGLDKLISTTKSTSTTLHKAIKSEIAKRKRQDNKKN